MASSSTHTGPIAYGKLLATLTVPLYLLDQVTKIAILKRYEVGDLEVVIANFFALGRWHNTGAAFSFMSGANGFFIGLASVAVVVLCVLARRGFFSDTPSRIGWALLLAGIVGNLTDRIIHGYVVDFLLFDLHVPYASPWPAFNVADSCIFIAAGLFIIQSFRAEEKPQPA